MRQRIMWFCSARAALVKRLRINGYCLKENNVLLVVSLLLALLMIGTESVAERNLVRYGQGLYNVDNGNFGGISIQFEYEFVSTQMKIRITNMSIAYSNKLRMEEPDLHRELLRQHVYESAQWLSSLRIKFTSEISLGAGELQHEKPTISGYATNSGADYYFFEPSDKARAYANKYALEHGENFYTENAMLWGSFKITKVELYEFENKVKAVRRELKAAKEAHEQKFASFISQATNEANQYDFAMAERDVKEAAALVNGNMQRKSQVRAVEQLIEQKKAEKEKMARQAEAEAQQKKQAAEAKAKAAAQARQSSEAAQGQSGGAAQGQSGGAAQGQSGGYRSSSSSAAARSSGSSAASQSGGSSGSGVSAAAQGPYKDPALNARYQEQQRKAEETRRNIAAMKAKMEQQQRDARRLDEASDRTFEGFSRANSFNDYVNSSKPLVNEFARQGNAAGAYTAAGVGIGLGILKAAQANKARNEAARQAQEAKQRQWEQEERERKRREAEQARLRQQAFELLIRQRHTLLEAMSDNEPIPLSTTPVEGDTVYYFIYAVDGATFDTKETKVYISNVFAIGRYRDGTWPYQSSIENEIQALSPYKEVMHGYYLHAEEANNMRQTIVEGFKDNKGVSVVDVAYREASTAATAAGASSSDATTEDQPKTMDLGVSIEAASKKVGAQPSSSKGKGQASSLGIPIGTAPRKTTLSPKKQGPKPKSEAAPLGIRIQP